MPMTSVPNGDKQHAHFCQPARQMPEEYPNKRTREEEQSQLESSMQQGMKRAKMGCNESTVLNNHLPLEAISPTPRKVGIQLVKCIDTQFVHENVKDSNIKCPIVSPGSIQLHWDHPPKNIFIVKHIHSKSVKALRNLVTFLVTEKKCTIYVEAQLFEQLKWPNICTFSKEDHELGLHNLIDLVICLGGDGTVLHTALQFPAAVPPILAFNLGSLGFLTSFEMENYKEYISKVFSGNVYLSIRMRLSCKIQRKNGYIEPKRYQVLNEIVIDRGPSPFLTNLDCYCSDTKITTVQADGLLVATPTGSTAYSMSGGGSIVHPSVSCILLTPICPHSLSFRPVILPDSTQLKIELPEDSRATAWVAFDGQDRQELQRGDSVVIQTSIWPVPLICCSEETSEWFVNLTHCLQWNVRKVQRSLQADDGDEDSDEDKSSSRLSPKL